MTRIPGVASEFFLNELNEHPRKFPESEASLTEPPETVRPDPTTVSAKLGRNISARTTELASEGSSFRI